MARHVDFDAAWDALTGAQAAPTMTVMGETVELPRDEPLALVLLRRQLTTDPSAVTFDRLAAVLALVFGEGIVEKWAAQGIGYEQLSFLAFTLPAAWLPDRSDGGDGEGEAQPPETGASEPDSSPTSSSTTSSTDGTSSAPTSTPDTGST